MKVKKNEKRLMIESNGNIVKEISLKNIKENLNNNDSIPMSLEFSFGYYFMFKKLYEELLTIDSRLSLKEKIEAIHKNIKSSNENEKLFYSMKKFSDFKELFEDKRFKTIYYNEFNKHHNRTICSP